MSMETHHINVVNIKVRDCVTNPKINGDQSKGPPVQKPNITI